MLSDMKKIVNEATEITNPSTIYYILRYKLKEIENGKSLCDQLELAGIQNFLHWTRNSGLF